MYFVKKENFLTIDLDEESIINNRYEYLQQVVSPSGPARFSKIELIKVGNAIQYFNSLLYNNYTDAELWFRLVDKLENTYNNTNPQTEFWDYLDSDEVNNLISNNENRNRIIIDEYNSNITDEYDKKYLLDRELKFCLKAFFRNMKLDNGIISKERLGDKKIKTYLEDLSKNYPRISPEPNFESPEFREYLFLVRAYVIIQSYCSNAGQYSNFIAPNKSTRLEFKNIFILTASTILKKWITLNQTTISPTSSEPTNTPSNRDVTRLYKMYDSITNSILNLERDNENFRKDLKYVENIYRNRKNNLFNNIDKLQKNNDIYSDRVKKMIKNNQNFKDDAFQMYQNLKESRVRALESEISNIEKLVQKNNEDNAIKSIVCKANSTKLNIYPIKIGHTNTGEFLIYLNSNCLSYKIDESGVDIKVNNCEIGGSSEYKMNFKFKEINNYKDYNKAISIENKEIKSLVMKTDDIVYPFYLVQPINHEGKCLYVNDKNIVNIRSITKSSFARFRGSNTIRQCIINKNI